MSPFLTYQKIFQITLSIPQSVEASSFSPEVVINQSLITVNGKNLDVSTEALLTIGNETKNQVNCIDRSVHYLKTKSITLA